MRQPSIVRHDISIHWLWRYVHQVCCQDGMLMHTSSLARAFQSVQRTSRVVIGRMRVHRHVSAQLSQVAIYLLTLVAAGKHHAC